MRFIAPLLLFVFLMPAQTSIAQITSRQVAAKTETPAAAGGYDSLKNAVDAQNCRQLIGQEIYILPKSKTSAANSGNGMKGYEHFSVDASGSEVKEHLFHPVQYEHQYSFISGYSALAGKYFKVVDVIDKSDPKFSPAEAGMYLKLEGREKRETVYFQFLQGDKNSVPIYTNLPFIITGYFEKLKQKNLNRAYVAQHDIAGVTDINNGKAFTCAAGAELTCTDLTLIEIAGAQYMTPVYIFKTALAEEFAVGLGNKLEGLSATLQDLKTKDQALLEKQQLEEARKKEAADQEKRKQEMELKAKQDAASSAKASAASAQAKKDRRAALIKKYGEKDGATIADGKVAIGMTAQMCTEAWGKPQDIHRTTGTWGVHEQWVYGLSSYLYFENGLLTTIQN